MFSLIDQSRTRYIPHWATLETAIGAARCSAWMYMASWTLINGVVIHAYKHQIHRNYLNLSEDLRAWPYRNEGYEEVPFDQAIALAQETACTAGLVEKYRERKTEP